MILKMHYVKKNSNEERYSKIQIEYLDKIVSLCKRRGLKLYFLSTPYHPYYSSKIEIIYSNLLLDDLNKYNENCINFKLPSVKHRFTVDGNHPNNEGSEFYSKKVASILSNDFQNNFDFE